MAIEHGTLPVSMWLRCGLTPPPHPPAPKPTYQATIDHNTALNLPCLDFNLLWTEVLIENLMMELCHCVCARMHVRVHALVCACVFLFVFVVILP